MKGMLLFLSLAISSVFGQQILIGNTTDSVFVKQIKETSKSNGYRSIRDDIYEADTYLNDRVTYEMHIGTGAMNHELVNKMGFIGLKVNIGQRKISNPRLIKPLIERAKLVLSEYDLNSEKEITNKIMEMENSISSYNNTPWYKRFGVGVLVPLIIELREAEDYQTYSITRDLETGELDTIQNEREYKTTRRTYNAGNEFYEVFSKTSFVIMYDVVDFFTISSGVNFQKELVLGISIDISTPITRAGQSFFQMFGEKAKTPIPNNNTPRNQYGY